MRPRQSSETSKLIAIASFVAVSCGGLLANESNRLAYNNPGLEVDLGVGLWAAPLPMDYDGDGDFDLLVASMGNVGNGTYFFENTAGDALLPVFKPGVRIGPGPRSVFVTYEDDGTPRVFAGDATEFADFPENGFSQPVPISLDLEQGFDLIEKPRAKHFGIVDLDGDGVYDLFRAVGEWDEYGWDDAFNDQGEWTNGPLKSYIYWMRNQGANEKPDYGEPQLLKTENGRVNTYGWPAPNFRDFDGDGDLDLLCGEFVDTISYFENIGSSQQPQFREGRKIEVGGKVFQTKLCMFQPVAFDWDRDGDQDLVVGEEDGRVYLMENTGKLDNGLPRFREPQYFLQEARHVKFGVLATPYGYDWDNDGDEDILAGNTAGEIGFIENLGGNPIKWAAPKLVEADGKPILIMAGENGSIQGPAERKWGYTVLNVADWDHDGLPDIIVNSILGKIVWYRNVGSLHEPSLDKASPIRIDWAGQPEKPHWNWWDPQPHELVTQWRTTPMAIDLNRDGLNDLVMLDYEGFLAFYERFERDDDKLSLHPPRRIFYGEDTATYTNKHEATLKGPGPLRLNEGYAGRSGRRKLALADWDGDGKLDLMVNSGSANFLRNVGTSYFDFRFKDEGPISSDSISSHSSSPTTVDWDGNGASDLLIGAEDGFFYFYRNPVDNYNRREN